MARRFGFSYLRSWGADPSDAGGNDKHDYSSLWVLQAPSLSMLHLHMTFPLRFETELTYTNVSLPSTHREAS